jgi:hypothetical protein
MLARMLFLAAVPALALTACDGGSPSEPEERGAAPDSGRTSVEALLTETFENAYNTMDTTAYESTLDDRYEFELLPGPGVGLFGEEMWDRETEMLITRRMFSGWSNADGVSVLQIALEMTYLGKLASTDYFPEQPDGETWYKALAEVNLSVATEDPTAEDGSGITVYRVFSNQEFIVRPDPGDADLWVIRRQVDRPTITKSGTEDASWSEVKLLFHE